ncbi:hypothetical protein TVAG_260170 [Trichomonas vaginalis G3]|uniref:Uncharacterized protein n=1 Tax=Trichomonas vaginalis (strain ATCC PRA-98 / G3) TaxID=412133 RepID=A2E8U9_TRIV3|nr:hypothetical protein TVAG_260170 [Trichomonas vaginalis G3]|eukprot:XP_001323154.1 hypothetical protein [Trichomonas vaginalis G3]
MKRTNSLRRSMPARIPITNETINFLKADTIQNNKKIKILKTKIEKINEKSLVRDNAIKNVFTQTKNDQKISTASPSTNENLKKQIETLKNTIDFRKKYLNELVTSDRYWKVGELESEIITLYQESVRTEQDCQTLHQKQNDYNSRINQIKQTLRIASAKYQEIPDIEDDISELQAKNQAYMRGNRKASATDILGRANSDINVCNDLIGKLKQQVQDLQKEIDTVGEDHQKIADESKEAVETLDNLIRDTIEKIQNALKPKDDNNEEDSKKDQENQTTEVEPESETNNSSKEEEKGNNETPQSNENKEGQAKEDPQSNQANKDEEEDYSYEEEENKPSAQK